MSFSSINAIFCQQFHQKNHGKRAKSLGLIKRVRPRLFNRAFVCSALSTLTMHRLIYTNQKETVS